MTDNLPEPAGTDESSAYSQWKERERLQTKAVALNKANILEALKLAGVSKVIIEFDGSADSGGIHQITCEGNNGKIPDEAVNEWSLDQKNTLVGQEVKLPNAIENFAYELLQHTNCGWENDAGAYGDITIDVAAGTVEHTHNARFEDYSTSTYTY